MTGQRSGPRSTAEEAVLTRLEALAAERADVPDEAFRTATRDRLVAMAAVADRRAPAGGVLRRLLTPRRPRLTAGLAAAALTVAACGGVVVAAQGAHAGDLLYGVKRDVEQTRLSLAADGERGRTLLAHAGTRLQEAGDLAGVQVQAAVGPSGGASGPAAGPDVRLLVDTLTTMDAQTTEGTADLTTRAVQGTDRAAVEELVDWAGRQRAGLTALSPAVPADARDAVAAAGRLVDEVAARGTALRGALACPSGPAVAGADALGPLPTACTAPPPAAATTVDPGPDATSVGSSTTAAPGAPLPPTAVPVPDGAVPRPTVSVPRPALPTPTVPGRPTPSRPAPSLPVPSLPVPSLPSLPVPSISLPVPGGGAPASAAPSSPGAVVQLPPAVPGVQLCVPPLITVDCRPSGG